MATGAPTVKTRFCVISDTHNQKLFSSEDTIHAYRNPLPSCDVLMHAGDITTVGKAIQYKQIIDVLENADAELKIVIAGNHDITLDENYYQRTGKREWHQNKSENLEEIREMWSGEHAKAAGIVYLEEGVRTFHLSNGATFTVGPR